MTRPASIVVLTGAGISAESGVATFRDRDGLWSRFSIEDVATPEAFDRDPDHVHAFYNARRADLPTVEPNAAHTALAELGAVYGDRLTVVTQNIDDLHERGGSTGVVHMHGELTRAICAKCGATTDWHGDMGRDDACPACGETGGLHPDVVWFGEMPYALDAIADRLDAADLFVAIGTSGAVYPAAGFVREARARGVRTLELTLEPSDGTHAFDEARHGPATELVPAFVAELLAEPG